MTFRFARNLAFQAEIEAEARYKAEMHELAEKVAENARQLAPRDTGQYASSIIVQGSIVATTAFAGHMVEWGSVNNPPYAPLRRACRAAGLRVREIGR
jgi:hypothetical protein